MNDSGGARVLAGDIGGTKTYVGLYDVTTAKDGTVALRPVREVRMENAVHSGLEGIITEFLGTGDCAGVSAAAFGVACPVEGNRCALTNLDWVLDGEEISRALGIPALSFINDLVATAWGVATLGPSDMRELKPGVERAGSAGLIAAGTGLGMAHLYWDGAAHRPSASEGGHADFAPTGEVQIELLRFLAGRFGHVSYERILSGPGLKNLYDFFVHRDKAPVPGPLAEALSRPGADAASIIAAEALRADSGGDRACADALSLFISIYGAEAGNVALRCMSIGGIYIGGGIAPKIITSLEDGRFIASFVDKGRFRGFMERVPVRVIMNDRAGLMGAAAYAATTLAPGCRVSILRT